jgi:hypothetical protein
MLLAKVPPEIAQGFERRIAPAFAVGGHVVVAGGGKREPLVVSRRTVEGDAQEFIGLSDVGRG